MTLVFANQKGGCGKTTSCHTTAFGLHNRGMRVLMVDTDAQRNLSAVCGFNGENFPTLYDVIHGEATFAESIGHVKLDGLDIVPSDARLAKIEAEFAGDLDAPYLLRDYLDGVSGQYDVCIVDTAPALNIMTTATLVAADRCIIPITPDEFSVMGLKQLNENIVKVRKRANPRLTVSGILLTRYDRTRLTKIIHDGVQEMAESLGTILFDTVIRSGKSIRESQVLQSNIFEEDPKSTVAQDYNTFIDELLRREDSFGNK